MNDLQLGKKECLLIWLKASLTLAFSKGVNFKTCTKGFLNGGAWSTFFPSPSIPHCLLFGSFILTGSNVTTLQLNSEYLPSLSERKAPHAKRSSPYRFCRVANLGSRPDLLLLSFFPLPHGGIMLSARIRRGYLKAPISFCSQCVGRPPLRRVSLPFR